MVKVYVGFGSNIGKRKENIEKAIKLLKRKCKIVKESSLYETEPVSYRNQNWFLNSVALVESNLSTKNFLKFCKSIEEKMNRKRAIINGPRIIDLDIIFYGKDIIDNDELKIPHSQAHRRLFVLIPLNEISPNLTHPLLKKKICLLLKENNSKKKVEKYLEER